MRVIQRVRRFAAAPAAALALSAALAIPALTVASGSAMAATAAGAARHKVHWNRPDAGQAVMAGTSAPGTASRTVLAWGRNTTGQLGDGTTTSSDMPVRVDQPSGWRASAVGSGPMAAHALAMVQKKS